MINRGVVLLDEEGRQFEHITPAEESSTAVETQQRWLIARYILAIL